MLFRRQYGSYLPGFYRFGGNRYSVAYRSSGLDSQSLWADEGYTVWISQFSPREICRITRADTAPPLYYILLHYWTVLFGNSEASLRALSAFFATISLPLFYLIARKILSNRISVALAMAMYSVSFFQIWYAKEARFYALLVFLSLGSVYWTLLCLENSTTLRLLGLAWFLSASLYTHNVALFYIPGLAVLWFVYPSEMKIGARLRNALMVAAVALLSYLPWLLNLVHQAQICTSSFLGPQAPGTGSLGNPNHSWRSRHSHSSAYISRSSS